MKTAPTFRVAAVLVATICTCTIGMFVLFDDTTSRVNAGGYQSHYQQEPRSSYVDSPFCEASVSRKYLPNLPPPNSACSSSDANCTGGGKVLISILSGDEMIRDRINVLHRAWLQHVVWPMYPVVYTSNNSDVATELNALELPYVMLTNVIGDMRYKEEDTEKTRAYREAVLRLLRFLEYAYSCLPAEFEWYFFVDDDTFVQVHNVVKLTEDLSNKTNPVVAGFNAHSCWGFCGGAGLLITRSAMREIVRNRHTLWVQYIHEYPQGGADSILSAFLREILPSVELAHAKTLFMYPPPSIHGWVKRGEGLTEYTATFHRCDDDACQLTLMEDCYKPGETRVRTCGWSYLNQTDWDAALERSHRT